MIRKVVPFRSWHLAWLGRTLEPGPMPDAGVIASLEGQRSYTGMVDGEVIACAGVVTQWATRHTCWALLGPTAPKHIRWITQEVRKVLAAVPGRIELTVRFDFPAGQKWAEMLGFEVETPCMKNFGPEGEDHVGYVRIRPHNVHAKVARG